MASRYSQINLQNLAPINHYLLLTLRRHTSSVSRAFDPIRWPLIADAVDGSPAVAVQQWQDLSSGQSAPYRRYARSEPRSL